MKFILIALMAISGLRAIMAGAAVVGGLISHGRFDGDDVTYLIDAGVIFWLASEAYSQLIRANVRKQRADQAMRALQDMPLGTTPKYEDEER